MLKFKSAEWSFDTLLAIICGLLDHAEDVNVASLETLKKIAKRGPVPISVTPISVIEHFVFGFTVSSGAAPETFRFLVELGTPEANAAIKRALEKAARNEDFKTFVNIIIEAKEVRISQFSTKHEALKTKGADIKSCSWAKSKN